MIPLKISTDRPLEILCLGAHSDDLEIGCGGTMLSLLDGHPGANVHWRVFSGRDGRAREAEAGAAFFLHAAKEKDIRVFTFRDGYFPAERSEIKDEFEALKETLSPDLILTHFRDDLHQDHRVLNELTWNTWRNHLILEYEIPKFDGDLGQPNCYVSLEKELVDRKLDGLMATFASQRNRAWFDPELFRGLLRIRGMEAASPSGYAEAFHARKFRVGR